LNRWAEVEEDKLQILFNEVEASEAADLLLAAGME
jgi:hypothetical protein